MIGKIIWMMIGNQYQHKILQAIKWHAIKLNIGRSKIEPNNIKLAPLPLKYPTMTHKPNIFTIQHSALPISSRNAQI